MSDSDIKYFWQHASNLTYVELREVVYVLQGAADHDFDFGETDHVMSLLGTTAASQYQEIKEAELEERRAAQARVAQ